MSEGNGKDTDKADVNDDTAIVVRIAGQAGPRAIEMSFGIPLKMDLIKLNKYMDKVTSVIDRQIAIGDLRRAIADLAGAEKALRTTVEQKAAFESVCAMKWDAEGRKGGWKPYGNQTNQLENWDKTIGELRDNRIPAFKAEIAKLEQAVSLEG